MYSIDVQLQKSKMAYQNYNISSLADEIGVSRGTISNLLKGENKPSYPVINAIYFTLKLTPEEGAAIFLALTYAKRKLMVYPLLSILQKSQI